MVSVKKKNTERTRDGRRKEKGKIYFLRYMCVVPSKFPILHRSMFSLKLLNPQFTRRGEAKNLVSVYLLFFEPVQIIGRACGDSFEIYKKLTGTIACIPCRRIRFRRSRPRRHT